MEEQSMLEREPSGKLTLLSGTRHALNLVSDKWTVQIVYVLKHGPQRLSDLQRAIEGISQKMLIHALRKLEQNGLVQRTVFPVVPPKVEYRLTTLGETLIDPLSALCDWTDAHIEEMEEARKRYHTCAEEEQREA